tara:strand:- start:1277 stop:1906 length:630 start_codon:yes stop_codon:yes gene_type:complete
MTKLCPRGKAAAKRKFKVYPSAYANAYASKICAGKAKDPSGVRRKDWGPKKANKGLLAEEPGSSKKFKDTINKAKKFRNKKPIHVIKAKKGVDVAPYIIKQSSQSGNTKIDDQGVGLDIYSKYGNFGISKSQNTQTQGDNKLKTKSKNITYGKNIKVGKSSNITIEGNYGKSKNKFDKQTTKGGKITFTKKFSRGGGIAIRGLNFQGVN